MGMTSSAGKGHCCSFTWRSANWASNSAMLNRISDKKQWDRYHCWTFSIMSFHSRASSMSHLSFAILLHFAFHAASISRSACHDFSLSDRIHLLFWLFLILWNCFSLSSCRSLGSFSNHCFLRSLEAFAKAASRVSSVWACSWVWIYQADLDMIEGCWNSFVYISADK